MNKEKGRVRNYKSAHDRFLKPAIINFFKTEFSRYFGTKTRDMIANELVKLFESLNRDKSTIKPGQILWNAIDKNTLAISKNKKFVPVVLTVTDDNDITEYQNGMSLQGLREKVIVRIIKEAFNQGAVLSMRDIGLLLVQNDTTISMIRKKYETKNNKVLPHVGSIHDVGTCQTHKKQIIYKAIVEKKDPVIVARETNHSQQAVDRYLKDFQKVKILYFDKKNIEYISIVTGISKNIVRQYIEIIEKYVAKK